MPRVSRRFRALKLWLSLRFHGLAVYRESIREHGPAACRNKRLPRHKLEDAVLQQLADLYRDGDLVAEALAQAEQEAERTRPEIE